MCSYPVNRLLKRTGLIAIVGCLNIVQPAIAGNPNIPYYDYEGQPGSSYEDIAPNPADAIVVPNPDEAAPSSNDRVTPLPDGTIIPNFNENATPAISFTRLEIDLSNRRLTLYQGDHRVKSYPVAVGRSGWRTPVGDFEVRQMIRDPAWTNPFTGEVIDGGDPGNPLGRYWIGFWTDGHNWVGMHGTPNPESVGRAASHGCIRLYNNDIQELFTLVNVGTPVTVVP